MIKVLVINMERSGVDMYRLTPHKHLDSDKFEVHFAPTLVDWNTGNVQTDLHKELSYYDIECLTECYLIQV